MKTLKLLCAALAAGMTAAPAEAAPASKMKVKMAEIYVLKAEKSWKWGGMSDFNDARERVDALKKESADDPAVIALDGRLAAVQAKIDGKNAEKAADAKAAQAKREAAAKAAEEAEAKSAADAKALAQKTPRPWPMEKMDWDHKPIKDYIEKLGTIKDEKEVENLKAALEARAKEDRAIVAAGGAAAQEAKEELDRYEYFLDQLGFQTLVGFFDGNVDLEKQNLSFNSLRIKVTNTSFTLKTGSDRKFYFFESNGMRTCAEGDDLRMIDEASLRYYYVYLFLKDEKETALQKYASMAAVSVNYIKEAKKNNTVENIDYAPMPKKGALHNEFAKEALVAVKTQAPSCASTDEVIIDADNWQMEYKGGVIKLRKFGGWAIRDYPHGRRAFRVQWCQDHQGGGSYGKLRLHATGGGNMYVK